MYIFRISEKSDIYGTFRTNNKKKTPVTSDDTFDVSFSDLSLERRWWNPIENVSLATGKSTKKAESGK